MSYNKYNVSTDYTKQLSHYIASTKYEDILPAVLERAKMLVLHTLGVSLCAVDLPQSQDTLAIAREMSAGGGQGVATLWGDGTKVSAEAAGFAGGALADMLDWEDCAWAGHPSAAVIPAAVIAAEAFGKSGKDLLTAVVVAYEVYHRVGMAAKSNINGVNVFAAVPAVAKLMDLNEEQINKALSMATACAAIPVGGHGSTMSDSLNYFYGLKVNNAFSICLNAKLGIANMMDAFDVPSAYLAHLKGPNPDWFLKDLGDDYLMMNVLVKHWPANFYVQTYVELADRINKKYHIDPDQIDTITICPTVGSRYFTMDEGFHSLTHAQFCINYGVAAYFYHPESGSIWYQEKTMTDPRVISLSKRLIGQEVFDQPGGKWRNLIQGSHPEKFMTVRMKDGTEYTESLFTHKGHPSYMFTREEFHDEFRSAVRKILSPQETEKVIKLVQSLDKLDSVAELCDSLYHKTDAE